MKISTPEIIDGEKIYTITTLGMSVEEDDVIKAGFHRVSDPTYAFRSDDIHADYSNAEQKVDIIL